MVHVSARSRACSTRSARMVQRFPFPSASQTSEGSPEKFWSKAPPCFMSSRTRSAIRIAKRLPGSRLPAEGASDLLLSSLSSPGPSGAGICSFAKSARSSLIQAARCAFAGSLTRSVLRPRYSRTLCFSSSTERGSSCPEASFDVAVSPRIQDRELSFTPASP